LDARIRTAFRHRRPRRHSPVKIGRRIIPHSDSGGASRMRLEGKVTLVTGGGSGIGEGAARAFAREGARVAIVDVRRDPAEAVARAIQAEGGTAEAYVADVAREDEIGDAVREAARHFEGLHVVFANAGINGMQTPIE